MEATFTFPAELYLWKPDGSWVFVALPIDVAEEIQDMPLPRKGFGSVKVGVEIGDSRWSTSVFPDKASGSFVLPIKKDIRAAQGLDVGDTADVTITVRMG